MTNEQGLESPSVVLSSNAPRITLQRIVAALAGALIAVLSMQAAAPYIHWMRFLVTFAAICFAIAGIVLSVWLYRSTLVRSEKRKLWLAALGAYSLATFSWLLFPQSAAAHPIFNTPLTGSDAERASVHVEIKDANESWFGTAELYLSVQSTRFPNNVRLLVPLNVGPYAGQRSRPLELPFQVRNGDTLIFNLLDEDDLSDEEETLLLDACKTTGFCLGVGTEIYNPEIGRLTKPAFKQAAEVLGKVAVQYLSSNPFDNMGEASFLVGTSRPQGPSDTNPISLLDENNKVHVQLRVYFPNSESTALSDAR